jgi:hypothetical protein
MTNANNVPPFVIPESTADALEKYQKDPAFHSGILIAAEHSEYAVEELLSSEGPRRIDMDPALLGLRGAI